MAVFVVSSIVFTLIVAALATVQHVRKAPLPVGCTPDQGECCMNQGADGRCAKLSVEERIDAGGRSDAGA